ncbi:MAG TPA: DoxX family membrane protein, partial [Solirubrobacteraceae bacterium]
MWKLVLRLTVGGLFAGHGAQKLFGAFGGGGLAETARTFEKLGLRPGRVHATAAGAAELGGGALLAAGAATPLAAATLTATMITAVDRVHLRNGPWI